jgi:hypothetical protein
VRGEWQPAKEVLLFMPSAALPPGVREIRFKGQRIVWDANGQPQKEEIDMEASYRGEGEYFGRIQQPAKFVDIAPPVLMPQKGAILFGMPRGPDGFLRGFRPELAESR